MLPDPVIVVPGITANYLKDQYPLPPEFIWTVLNKNYERAALHPDDLRYEALEPARVAPDQLYEIAYRELIEELRYNLKTSETETIPVYPFSYDWRQPIENSEAALADFVEEVIARTSLMPGYARNGYTEVPRVNLVGHSMGGLVIAGYLEAYAQRRRVGKVATLASPFQGSFEPVIKVTTGTANLGTSVPSSREREAARLTPALYQLLPSFDDAVTLDGANHSIFDPNVWQRSIMETIAGFYRLHGIEEGLDDNALMARARVILTKFLGIAQHHRDRLNGLDLAEAGLTSNDWLCVVGVDSETRIRLQILTGDKGPDFHLTSDDRKNAWNSPSDTPERHQTGDGTVPFNGAIPRFLPYNALVCLSPDDFGYWEEIGDRALTKLAGFHGILPNMNVAHRLIVRHFTGRQAGHDNIWGRRPPGVAPEEWAPPIADLRDKQPAT